MIISSRVKIFIPLIIYCLVLTGIVISIRPWEDEAQTFMPLYSEEALSNMPSDQAACWQAVSNLFYEIQEIVKVPISCQPIGDEGYAGLFNGSISIFYYGASSQYYHEVIWHETGHAWESRNLTYFDRLKAMEILGWDEWQGEAYADIFALASGNYKSYNMYDPYWRAGGNAPNQEQIDALTNSELLPVFGIN